MLLLLSIVVFQLFFLSVGLVISLLVKRIRSVTPYAMALAFGMYVLSVFGDMLGESVLEKITPFKHFEPRYIVQHGAYDLPLVLISVRGDRGLPGGQLRAVHQARYPSVV